MFKELFYPLVKYFSLFNVFQYITFRAAYAAVTALLISFILGPTVISRLTKLKLGQEIRSDGPQTHLVKAGTPTMGGVLIMFSVIISVLLWQDLHEPNVWILLGAVVGFGGLGFVDDYLKITKKNSDGLRSGVKFGGQILISLVLMLLMFRFTDNFSTDFYVPFLKNPLLDLSWFYIPFGIFYIVGFSNAVNLTDGLDGLASSLMLIVCVAFALVAYASGHSVFADYLQIPFISGGGEMTVVVMALLGAVVGFLWFNCHPAEVMMGDTGSLMMGGVLGVLALMLKKEVLLVIIGGVFVIETLSVMIQVFWYKRTKKRVFKMAPLHHHFEMLGWAESKVVMRFLILGGMFALLGLSTLKIR